MASQVSAPARRPPRLSRWTGNFLRFSLLPVIALGVPAWPLLAISCAIPFVSLVTIPLFLLLSLLLVYSLSWFTYLVLAQADAPHADSTLTRVLPFLPYSPLKCLKVTWAGLLYSSTAVRLVLPAVLDWSYRRVMVLGTTAGAAVVKEAIPYGPAGSDKRLDVYLPPARSNAPSAVPSPDRPRKSTSFGKRHRKHSTLFNEPPPAVGPDGSMLDHHPDASSHSPHAPNRPQRGAAVIVFLPSAIPPILWTNKRKTYLQLALRLRRMGHCVVIPDLAYFPESRIRESIIDVRLVLNWVGENIARFGGDPERIHLMGHGLSAHLALLTLTQEAIVLSREGILEAQAYRDKQKAAIEERWQKEEEDRRRYTAAAAARAASSSLPSSPPRKMKVAGSSKAHPDVNDADEEDEGSANNSGGAGGNAWVDEPTSVEESASTGLAPGIVLPASSPFKSKSSMNESTARATKRLAKQMDALGTDGAGEQTYPPSPAAPSPSGSHTPAGGMMGFPTTPGSATSRRERYLSSQQKRWSRDLSPSRGDDEIDPQEDSDDNLLDIPIPNGLRRVNIYAPEIDVPPVAGLILFSGISDVIKGFRNETERGIEDLSVLRRSCGPSHTSCLLHSPAHLLYAAKNLVDPTLLPPKVLLVHGGQDAVVPIEQSTLLKTLLVGIGVGHVRLRAYRKLGHVESVACLFLGMNRGLKRYMRMVQRDLDDFLEA